MAKTILINTDFSVKSLGLLRAALENNQDDSLSIILAEGYTPGSSISELLFFSRSKLLESRISEEFRSSLKMIKSRYTDRIEKLRIEFFIGGTNAAFANFLAANSIDEAYFSTSQPLRMAENSFDLRLFIKKSEVPFHEVTLVSHTSSQTKDVPETFADLFFLNVAGKES